MKSMKLLAVLPGNCIQSLSKNFSTGPASLQRNFKVLVVGAGAGGCSVANKFAHHVGGEKVGIIEPNDEHYYQPMWTLVGGGVKKLQDSVQKMSKLLPEKGTWMKTKAVAFDPEKCTVTTAEGEEVKYEYLIVATGLQLNYNKIKGLPEAFDTDPTVCSNYNYNYVQKTWPAIQNFKGGNAIFTFPNTPIKCAGAPQKIMYLAEDWWRKNGMRDNANIIFNSSLGVIFGVKKYANSLNKVIESRGMKVNYKRNLIEVRPETREAIFQNLDSPTGETETFKYEFLHVTPPMSTPDVVRDSPLVDANGYVDVDKNTLQHKKYSNIFGIGDCTNAPTSKTAAAAAAQCGILETNLRAVMADKPMTAQYDGYTSCPLITARGKCILAEFDFDGNPLETFPINQGKERMTMYHMKKDVMPHIYWHMMLNGHWNGPGVYRKLMHFGMDGPEKQAASA
ncbi:SQOR [Mytilus coruscus]|uniref:Sulfide:quinone oxidoreductase, mitochondrial n=1 Tax=Mytilus coruscus TaxID=42192 RepID=A0A6J8D2X2_MYTCO|nr:SQOR [Mytilus coruscus]